MHWQEVLDIARQLLVELGQNNDSEIEESKAKLEQLKTVLEMYVDRHFSNQTPDEHSLFCITYTCLQELVA